LKRCAPVWHHDYEDEAEDFDRRQRMAFFCPPS
jgi:hypothetical protein